MKFKIGDRIKSIINDSAIGTVINIDQEGIYVEFDNPVECREEGSDETFSCIAGYITEDQIELLIKSDPEWASLWDAAARAEEDDDET